MPNDRDRRPPASPSRVNRRTALRLLAAAPALGAAAVAARTGWGTAVAALQGSATPSAAATACAASPAAASPAASPAASVIVKMTTQLRFEPAHLTIKVGETVQWNNASILPHTATDDPAKNPVATSHPDYALLPDGAQPWSSELLQPGETFSHTFTVPGEYRYFCIPHVLSGMRGTITVEC